MLLRCVVLFILVTVVASVNELVDGWNANGHAHFGGVYWIHPGVFDFKLYAEPGFFIPFAVLDMRHDVNKYRVVRMTSTVRSGRLCAKSFFSPGVKLRPTSDEKEINQYYIMPHENREVENSPEIMQSWKGHSVVIMLGEGKDRLVAILDGMVDGWNTPFHKDGPLFGGVYWIHRHFLGLEPDEAENYIPCVVIRRFVTWHYLVIRMELLDAPQDKAQPATKFFRSNAKLQTRKEIINLERYHIFPREHYKLKGNPKIMQLWKGGLLMLPEEGLKKLVVVSNGLVDGWNERDRHEPVLYGVYWICPEDLSTLYNNGHIPCVVLQELEKGLYRVVRISLRRNNAQSAKTFFAKDATMQVGTEKASLNKCYINPGEIYELRGDPKIMLKWEEGGITTMTEDGAARLADLVFLERGNKWLKNQHQLGPRSQAPSEMDFYEFMRLEV